MIVEKQPLSFRDYLNKFDDLSTQLHNLEMEMDDKYQIHKPKDRKKSEQDYKKMKDEMETAKQMTKLLPIDAILKHDKKDVSEAVKGSTDLRFGTEIDHKRLTKFTELILMAMKNTKGKLSSSISFRDKQSEYMYANITSHGVYCLYTFEHISQKVELHDKETGERETGELHFVYKNNKPTIYIDEWLV